MKPQQARSLWILVLASILPHGSVLAKHRPLNVAPARTQSEAPAPGKAVSDTIYLIGGADRQDGRFQDDLDSTIPDTEGWLSVTDWESASPRWNIDTFNAELLDPGQVDNHAMWCGDYYLDCNTDSVSPGYGNSWDVSLQWQRAVGVPQDSVTARITAWINYNTEPGYDYLYLQVNRGGEWFTLQEFNGTNQAGGVFVPEFVDEIVSLAPEDYVDDMVQYRWRFRSDGAFSDEDCMWPTDGAIQIDKISVMFDQGTGPVLMTYDDFEDPQDVNWVNVHTGCSVGKVWPRLADAGLAHPNLTPQIAFLDDGTGCDFSDGTPGVRWTYGPEGYVVYCETVLDYQKDQMFSPPLELPADIDDYDGARLEFDVYKHAETFTPNFTWAVRVGFDDGTAWRRWQDHFAVYEMNKPAYSRESFVIDPFILEGADKLQISLGYFAHPFFGPFDCDGFTPAPYFDNVAVKLFKRDGPYLYTTSADSHHRLLQDAFPASGGLDLQNLGANSVPVVPSLSEPRVKILARARDGAELTGPPELHWKLQRNPLFDPYRSVTPPNPVLGDSVATANYRDPRGGVAYAFTLPDSGWFFPGDVFHYYFEAEDNRPFGTGVTQLPADTTGFSTFGGDPGFTSDPYHPYYIVRALPTVTDTVPGTQPKILLWEDYDRGPEDDYWHHTLASLGLFPGQDYDLFQGTFPGSDYLGAAASMSGYESLLYSCGYPSLGLLLVGDSQILADWIAQGGKKLLLMGDNLADYLDHPGDTVFMNDLMGVSYGDPDIRPHIGDQTIPLVVPSSGNTPGLTTAFRVNSTLKYSDFDAVSPIGTGESLFEFTDAGGQAASYPYAAGIYNHHVGHDAHLITLPYSLEFVVDANGTGESGQTARSQLLGEILEFFGNPIPGPDASDVPMARELTVSSYPNPFNPSTTIAYSMPGAGHLQIKIYDLRGRVVRTLLDQQVAPGHGEAVWNGADDRGTASASGVYFCRVVAGTQERLIKLSMIK